MHSQSFIKAAGSLIERIRLADIGSDTIDEENAKRDAIQKDINQMFSGLQNPTLPSASRLREVALANGFSVDQRVQQRLDQAERFWQV